MPRSPQLDVLLEYTAWERAQWQTFFTAHGAALLRVSVGPHADGRFPTIGHVIRHVFSAEVRYVDRIRQQVLNDTDSISVEDVAALFGFGIESRHSLVQLMESFPATAWQETQTYEIGRYRFTGTPAKIVFHALLHETRHWAQIATMLRLHGSPAGLHDFLVSPVLGGHFCEHTG